ncbi:MAG TPA: hypothetical protein DDW77_11405 [Verrucomicrobiales bacterium]|nr:hypothetical protein [Verrucomicrobiales bacterium]
MNFAPIAKWEMELILWLQSAPQWLMEAMRWISELGHTPVLMSLVIVVSLAARRNVGIRTLQFLSLSGFYMVLAKDFFQHPRPYWLEPDIVPWGPSGSFGMPSGHAMMAWVWYGLCAKSRNSWIQTSGLALVFCIGCSRAFLGLHSPLQIAVGWTIGYLLMRGLFSANHARSETKEKSLTPWWELGWLLPGWVWGVCFYRTTDTVFDLASWPGLSTEVAHPYTAIPTLTYRTHLIYAALFLSSSFWARLSQRWQPNDGANESWRTRSASAIGGLAFGAIGYVCLKQILPPIQEAGLPGWCGWGLAINFAIGWLWIGWPKAVQWIHSRYCHACPSGH